MSNLLQTNTGYQSAVPSAIPGLTGVAPELDYNSVISGVLSDKNSTPMDKLYASMLGKQWNTPQASFLGMDQNMLKGIQGGLGIGSSLFGLYSDIMANKRADKAFGMQTAEYNRGVKKDKDFASAIQKSGLGSYSAGA